MSNASIQLTDQIYDYMLDVSLREPAVLKKLRDETAERPNRSMQISPEQGQFMQMLVKLIGGRKHLEIGVFTGYSSTCIALAMGPEGRIVACDVSEEFTSVARRYWAEANVAGQVDLRIAPALETLQKMVGSGEKGFDTAFIDADKQNMRSYYEFCLRLVRPGGLIMLDNTLWGGKVADPSLEDEDTTRIRELNEFLHQDERVDLSLLPVGDGLTLCRVR